MFAVFVFDGTVNLYIQKIVQMRIFTHHRLFGLIFLTIFVLDKLSNFSQAALLENPSLGLVNSARLLPHESTSTGDRLGKSKSLPNLRLENFPDEFRREPITEDGNPKTDNDGTKYDPSLYDKWGIAHEGDNDKAKVHEPLQGESSSKSRLSHSSQSYHPINLLPPHENPYQSPPYQSYYQSIIAPENNQGAQNFPSFTYPLGSEEFTSTSPYMVYAQPGVLYSVVQGKPKEIFPPAITASNIPNNRFPLPQFAQPAPNYVSPGTFHGPQSQLIQYDSPMLQAEGGNPAAYPNGYSYQGYGLQRQPLIMNYNSGPSSVYNPSQYVNMPLQRKEIQGHYSGYNPRYNMDAPLKQPASQYHQIHSYPYKATNSQPPEYQGTSSSATTPYQSVAEKSRSRFTSAHDDFIGTGEKNSDPEFKDGVNRKDSPQINNKNKNEDTDASSSSSQNPSKVSSDSKTDHRYLNDLNDIPFKNEEKPTLTEEELKNHIKNSKEFVATNDPVSEEDLNENSKRIPIAKNSNYALDNRKGSEIVEFHKVDIGKLNSAVKPYNGNGESKTEEIKYRSSSSKDSELERPYRRIESGKSDNYEKPEAISSSLKKFPFLKEAIKVKNQNNAIKLNNKQKTDKLSLNGSENRVGQQKVYRRIHYPTFQKKYSTSNHVLDKTDELIINDDNLKKHIDDSQRYEASKSVIDHNLEKSLILKEILGIKDRHVPNKDEDLLKTGKTIINQSEGKTQKDTLSSSIYSQRDDFEKVDSSQSKKSLNENIQESNKDLSHYQTQQTKEESDTTELKKSEVLGKLEQNIKPLSDVENLSNTGMKDVEKVVNRVENIPKSYDESKVKNKKLTKTIESQSDRLENLKIEKKMNREQFIDQKGIDEEKRIEPKYSQNLERFIPAVTENKEKLLEKSKLDSTSIIPMGSQTSTGKERSIKTSKKKLTIEETELKPSSFQNDKKYEKELRDLEIIHENDEKIGNNLSKHAKSEKTRSDEKNFIHKGRIIKSVEKSIQKEVDTKALQGNLRVQKDYKISKNKLKPQKDIDEPINPLNAVKTENHNSRPSENIGSDSLSSKEKEKITETEKTPKISSESSENLKKSSQISEASTSGKRVRGKQAIEEKMDSSTKVKPKESLVNKKFITQSKSIIPVLHDTDKEGDSVTVKHDQILSREEKELFKMSNPSENEKRKEFVDQESQKRLLSSDSKEISTKDLRDLSQFSDDITEPSLNYQLNKNLKSFKKLSRNNEQEILRKKIKKQFFDSHVFSSKAQETWNSWKLKKLDPRMMFNMGIILKFDQPSQIHTAIDHQITHEIRLLSDVLTRNKPEYEKAESWYISNMAPFEGQRRILALRNHIRHYRTVERCMSLVQIYPKDRSSKENEILSLDEKFSIISGESGILLSDNFFAKGEGPDPMPKIIKESFGNEEAANRRVEFLKYAKYRNNPAKWWKSKKDFKLLDIKYGVDYLRALKVADILQFGWYTLMDIDCWGRMTAEDSFFGLMDLMKSYEKNLPWNESPERFWLMSYEKEKYLTKLVQISNMVSQRQDLIKQKLLENPVRRKDFEKIFKGSLNEIDKTRLGELIIWWDLGYKPQKFFEMKKVLESIGLGLMSKNIPQQTASQKSWVDLISDTENRRMTIDFCLFFRQNLNTDIVEMFRDRFEKNLKGDKKGLDAGEDNVMQLQFKQRSSLLRTYLENKPKDSQIVNELIDVALYVYRSFFSYS